MVETFSSYTPNISPLAFIHQSAVVIGNIQIGPHSSVWPGTVLRGDMGGIYVGEQSSIQDGTIAHVTQGFSETRIGNCVTVGHRVILHGCIVEDHCLIGMGSILLDNCKIGKGSLIAAGSLITVGTQIPPNSLVMGSPGKVIREINEKDRMMIEEGCKIYVEYTKRFLAATS